jgi:hypothetical protein
MRPSFMAVGGYDGMRVIMEGLKATKGEGGARRWSMRCAGSSSRARAVR